MSSIRAWSVGELEKTKELQLQELRSRHCFLDSRLSSWRGGAQSGSGSGAGKQAAAAVRVLTAEATPQRLAHPEPRHLDRHDGKDPVEHLGGTAGHFKAQRGAGRRRGGKVSRSGGRCEGGGGGGGSRGGLCGNEPRLTLQEHPTCRARHGRGREGARPSSDESVKAGRGAGGGPEVHIPVSIVFTM